MNILHINVTLNSGGAANIAMQIHMDARIKGYSSNYIYGWGKKGGKAQEEVATYNASRCTSRLQVYLNYATHLLIGSCPFQPPTAVQCSLENYIQDADVVHIHVIHSYCIPLSWLMDLLRRYNKPIVWTLHDYWILTGRCANPNDCRRWHDGCGQCPDLSRYPSSLFDRSRHEYFRKVDSIQRYKDKIYFVAPSQHVLDICRQSKHIRHITLIRNWVDQETSSLSENLSLSRRKFKSLNKKLRLIIVSADLSDERKNNPQLVKELADIEGVSIETVGKRRLKGVRGIHNHGYIDCRSTLCQKIQECDALLMLSKIETFGLVICEALICGVPVIGMEAPATNEILSEIGIETICSGALLIEYITKRKYPAGYENYSPWDLHERSKILFGSSKGLSLYWDLYKRLLHQ